MTEPQDFSAMHMKLFEIIEQEQEEPSLEQEEKVEYPIWYKRERKKLLYLDRLTKAYIQALEHLKDVKHHAIVTDPDKKYDWEICFYCKADVKYDKTNHEPWCIIPIL